MMRLIDLKNIRKILEQQAKERVAESGFNWPRHMRLIRAIDKEISRRVNDAVPGDEDSKYQDWESGIEIPRI